MKRSSPHTLGVLVALSCPACDLASRSLGEFVEPRPQRGDLDLDQTDGLSHLTVPAIDDALLVVPFGDLDRDGYDDWATVDSSHGNSRRVHLLYGREGGYPPEANLDSIADAVFTIESSAPDQWWWVDIRALGDLDADGHTDLAIALDEVASDDIDNYASTSSVHIVWGAEQRLQGAVEISSLPVVASSGGDAPRSGMRLHGAGDINGDGADDVVLLSDSAQLFEGPWTREAPLDAEHARPILGGEFASTVVAGSDLDGDGFDDLVLSGDGPAGGLTVVFGAPSAELDVSLATPGPRFTSVQWTVADVGDVNGDGAADLLVDTGGVVRIFAGPLARAQRTVAFDQDEPHVGRYLFAAAVVGDIDGDGVEDVAASHEEELSPFTDVMGLYFGGADLASKLEAGAAVVAFRSAPAEHRTDSSFVEQIATSPIGRRLGDVNGDGFDDWAAVITSACTGCGLPGALHLIYGASYE